MQQISKFIFSLLLLIGMCCGFYMLGKSRAEVKIIKEQVEVIRYVEQKKSEIYMRPNRSRDELLERMRAGHL